MYIQEGELRSLEYNPEREREELMEQSARGRNYKAAREVLGEVITAQRENIIKQLETADFSNDNDAAGLVLYLRVLRRTHDLIQSEIDKGELAEDELLRIENE